MFQLVKNYYNYSDCNDGTHAISHKYLKHYGGYRYNVDSTDLVCDKLSFIQIPKVKSNNILPYEWEFLGQKIRDRLKLLIIANDTNNLMTKNPYHASMICWHDSRLSTSCFAKLGCYPNINFWIVHNCFMSGHEKVDVIVYGVSQVSNKKLYIFADGSYGAPLWQLWQLSLSNIEVYNYCVNQLFIHTTWDDVIGMTFWLLLDYLLSKNAKFGHCPIDIYIFLFNTGTETTNTKWLRLSKQLQKWINFNKKSIEQNKLIKSFNFGIKNHVKQFMIDVKLIKKDWEQGVTRVFDHRNISQTQAKSPKNLVEAQWKKLVKLIYDEC